MRNLLLDPASKDAAVAKYPGKVKMQYLRAVTLDAEDGPEQACVVQFQPSWQEVARMVTGGTVEIALPGVATPPLVKARVVGGFPKEYPESDLHAMILYDAGSGHALDWTQIPESLRALWVERATALWDFFKLSYGLEDDECVT